MANNQLNTLNLNISSQDDSMPVNENKTSKNVQNSNTDISLNNIEELTKLNIEIDELLGNNNESLNVDSSSDETQNFDELIAEIDRVLIPTKQILLNSKTIKDTYTFNIKKHDTTNTKPLTDSVNDIG